MIDAASFVDDLAHQLSQPLTTLRCGLELGLLRSQGEPQYREAIEHALETTDEIISTLRNLRQLASPEFDERNLREVKLGELAGEVAHSLGSLAEADEKSLVFTRDSNPAVLADEDRLWHLLWTMGEMALRESAPKSRLLAELHTQYQSAHLTLSYPPRDPNAKALVRKSDHLAFRLCTQAAEMLQGTLEFQPTSPTKHHMRLVLPLRND